MRSRSRVQAVMLDLIGEEEEGCIPTKVEVNSWVSLMPGKRGGHAKDARKHGGSTVEGSYKARVLQFRMNAGSTAVEQIRVQHAYMHRQLQDLRRETHEEIGGANYLYLSEYEDWVDAKSVIGIITVVHAEIGELYRGGRSHKDLVQASLFFYNARYYPRSGHQAYGRIEIIPLPSFEDPSWPLPDMLTTESFRAKMRLDFLTAMKPSTGSKQTHLQWFMPIIVMVDLFASAPNIHKTKTLFIFKNVTEELMLSVMDSGWDSKVTKGGDVIRCTVDLQSIIFRFHISRSTLYANFQFNRERYLPPTGWQPIDQIDSVDVVTISYEYRGWKSEIEVGRAWPLTALRQEVSIALGADCPDEFLLWIADGEHAPQKINQRNESKYTAADVVFPKVLKIVSK